MALNAEEMTFAGGSVHMAGGTPEAAYGMFPEEALTFGHDVEIAGGTKEATQAANIETHQGRMAELASQVDLKGAVDRAQTSPEAPAPNNTKGKGFER